VEVYAITAQPQNLAEQMMRDLNLRFTCFSDPTHVLRNYLAEQDLITIRVSGGENATDSNFYQVHPKIKNYKHGVAQPGVLCVKRDRTVLYSWAIDPSSMNLGGASDRPVPADIWAVVQLKMAGTASDQEIQQAYNRVRTRGNCSVCTIL
jgi:hypothetical protein